MVRRPRQRKYRIHLKTWWMAASHERWVSPSPIKSVGFAEIGVCCPVEAKNEGALFCGKNTVGQRWECGVSRFVAMAATQIRKGPQTKTKDYFSFLMAAFMYSSHLFKVDSRPKCLNKAPGDAHCFRSLPSYNCSAPWYGSFKSPPTASGHLLWRTPSLADSCFLLIEIHSCRTFTWTRR